MLVPWLGILLLVGLLLRGAGVLGQKDSLASMYPAQSPYDFVGIYPPGCDTNAAQQCEYNLLNCQLFSGPANDPVSACKCGRTYYGECLRLAGCSFANEVGALTQHQIYTKTCVDFIVKYNCPDTLICAVNCASSTQIDKKTAKIIPFNNYGKYFLRVRICRKKLNDPRFAQYAMVQTGYCSDISDYQVCNRYIPPNTYTPLAIPFDTTYVDVDSCIPLSDGTYYCFGAGEFGPQRIFGNEVIWPTSSAVKKTNASICSTDSDCLGSVCNLSFQPHTCDPKSIKHIENSGRYYLSSPFSAIT
jgi:hypothetical protein